MVRKTNISIGLCLLCKEKTKLISAGLFDDRYGAPGKYDIHQCVSCRYATIDPEVKRSNIGKLYAKYYPHSRATVGSIRKGVIILPTLIEWVMGLGHTCHWNTKKGQDVLDVGSGTGKSLLEIRELLGSPYGIDPDPSVQKVASELNIPVFEGFITDNPFPGKKFDLITASQVIEHEPDPEAFLFAAKNKLKSGGKIIISTPNLNSLGRHLYKNRWINWHIPYHLSFFTYFTFQSLAKKVGLKIIHSKTSTPNLWTVLQWQALSYSPVEGQPSKFWNHHHISQRFDYAKKFFLYLLAFPYSRLVDLLGFGESLVVTMESQ